MWCFRKIEMWIKHHFIHSLYRLINQAHADLGSHQVRGGIQAEQVATEEHRDKQLSSHSHGQFSNLTCMLLDCGGKLERPPTHISGEQANSSK